MQKSFVYGLVLSLICCFAINQSHAQLVIDSLDGEVTQHEVDTFISNVSATSIPTAEWNATNTHNLLADGKGGMTLEGINTMAEITNDIPSLSTEHTQLLNLAITWNDAWLTHRNDLPAGEGRVMWTGNVEPVWPPNCPTCTSPTYYESEVGDTIGHMAYTAYNILKTPSVWNNTVPDGDPNNFGTTYLARAKTYVSMLEFSMSNSFTPYFIDPNTLLIKRPSTSQGYQSSFHNVNAWNVMMMLSNAYWRLAQCHVILGDNPSLVTQYKTTVQKTVDMFVQNAQPLTAPDGTAVYDWGYCNFGDCTGHLTGEQNGVHGSYDIWGLTRAYASGYSTVPTAAKMKTYADTVVHEMVLSIDSAGAATYASFNDRCCSTSTYSYLPYGYMFLTPYNTDIYKPAANADINSGRQAGDPGTTADILWAKHWIFAHSQPPDFSLSATPASQTVVTGNGTSYTATVAPINGFAGAVSFTVSGAPSGASCSAPSISGGSGSSTVSCSTSTTTPVGTYTLTITGTSGSLSHSASVSLTVNPPPDFSLSASPSSQTVIAGNATTYTATVSPNNGFTGTVTLTVGGLPTGATCSAPSITGGSGSSTVTCSTTTSVTPATYTLTITGTSGSLSHTASVSLTVNPPPPPDFALTASPSSQTVIAGGPTTYTANVTPSNGFTGTVTLTVGGLPAGASCSAPSITGGSGSSTVACSTTSSVTPATYTLTITGASGSLSHSATVSLIVNPASVCTTATANGTWNNSAFSSHSGSFTATFDATPSISGQNSAIGISKGSQSAITGFANIVAFSTTGIIQARNGSSYFNSTIPFSGGTSYHFRLTINVTNHTYSVFVTPAGGSEQTVGTNFAFRTEQNTVTSLDHWGAWVNSTSSGTLQVCNFTAQ